MVKSGLHRLFCSLSTTRLCRTRWSHLGQLDQPRVAGLTVDCTPARTASPQRETRQPTSPQERSPPGTKTPLPEAYTADYKAGIASAACSGNLLETMAPTLREPPPVPYRPINFGP